jgi:hypothetical protein
MLEVRSLFERLMFVPHTQPSNLAILAVAKVTMKAVPRVISTLTVAHL